MSALGEQFIRLSKASGEGGAGSREQDLGTRDGEGRASVIRSNSD